MISTVRFDMLRINLIAKLSHIKQKQSVPDKGLLIHVLRIKHKDVLFGANVQANLK